MFSSGRAVYNSHWISTRVLQLRSINIGLAFPRSDSALVLSEALKNRNDNGSRWINNWKMFFFVFADNYRLNHHRTIRRNPYRELMSGIHFAGNHLIYINSSLERCLNKRAEVISDGRTSVWWQIPLTTMINRFEFSNKFSGTFGPLKYWLGINFHSLSLYDISSFASLFIFASMLSLSLGADIYERRRTSSLRRTRPTLSLKWTCHELTSFVCNLSGIKI